MAARPGLAGTVALLAVLLATAVLAGCGQKGPLYLPAKPKVKVPAAAPAPVTPSAATSSKPPSQPQSPSQR